MLNCLSETILTSKKSNEVTDATGLRSKISFNYVLMITLQFRVLKIDKVVSKTLKNPKIEIGEACCLLKKIKLHYFMSNFDLIKEEDGICQKLETH